MGKHSRQREDQLLGPLEEGEGEQRHQPLRFAALDGGRREDEGNADDGQPEKDETSSHGWKLFSR